MDYKELVLSIYPNAKYIRFHNWEYIYADENETYLAVVFVSDEKYNEKYAWEKARDFVQNKIYEKMGN